MVSAESELAVAPLEVSLQGRRFPWPNRQPAKAKTTPHEIPVATKDQSLRQRMVELVVSQLVWRDLPHDADRTVIAKTYIDSLNQLHSFQEQLDALLHKMCVASLEFRHESPRVHAVARDEALQHELPEPLGLVLVPGVDNVDLRIARRIGDVAALDV